MRKIYHNKNQKITIAETKKFYHICGPNALISLLGMNTFHVRSEWLKNSKKNNFFYTCLQASSTHSVYDLVETQTNTFARAFNDEAFNDKSERSFNLRQDQMVDNPSLQILSLNKSEKTLQYINDIIRTSDVMDRLLTPTETLEMSMSIKDYKEKAQSSFFKKTHSAIFANNELYLVLTSRSSPISYQDTVVKLSVRKIDDDTEREFTLNILNDKAPESALYNKMFLSHSTFMHAHYNKDKFEHSNMSMHSYFTEAVTHYEESVKSRKEYQRLTNLTDTQVIESKKRLKI